MSLVELPSRSPHAPDPFSFAEPDRVTEILQQAGWMNVDVESFITEVTLGGGVDYRLAALHAYDFSAVKAVVDSNSSLQPGPVIDAMQAALKPHEENGIVKLPGAAWVFTARA